MTRRKFQDDPAHPAAAERGTIEKAEAILGLIGGRAA